MEGTSVGTWVFPLGVSPGVHGPGFPGRVTCCPGTWVFSSGHVTQCPWRGQELRWGLQLLGTVDARPAGPISQDPASLMGQHGKVF